MAEEKDQFAGMDEVKTNTWKRGKIGDWLKGTLIAKDREIENKLSAKGGMQRIFEFKVAGGSFHQIDANKNVLPEPTILEEGSIWAIFASGVLEAQLSKVKVGQVAAVRYTEDKPSSKPGLNPTKITKVYMGEMDPNYKGEQALPEL